MKASAWLWSAALLSGCAAPGAVELPDLADGPTVAGPSGALRLPTLAVRTPEPGAKAAPRAAWGLAPLPDLHPPTSIEGWPDGFDSTQLLPSPLPGDDLAGFGRRLARSAAFRRRVGELIAVRMDAAQTASILAAVRTHRDAAERNLANVLDALCGAGELLQGANLEVGGKTVLQSAALIAAPLAQVLAVERDYVAQMAYPGQDALDLFPVAGTHLLGRDGNGSDRRYLDVLVHKDLGLLLGQLAYVLHHVDGFDSEGTLVTDNYARPRTLRGCKGFKWLAGRNTYIVVPDAAGREIATLVVTQLTFDIDGLWESDRHRREAIRFSLGNLKRRSEELAR